jgi:hypothetical protein
MQKSRKTWILAAVWVLLAAAALTAATYAWFTFSPYTNVEPVSSTISQGDVSLLIANDPNEAFDKTCVLTPDSRPDELQPLSTADLEHFSRAVAQSPNGISILYQDVSSRMEDYLIHGTLYLRSLHGACGVYLNRSGMDLGTDTQALAALRLALRITTANGTKTCLFRLDDLGDTSSAESTQTVPQAGTVVSGVSGSGEADYVSDPSEDMSPYFAEETETDQMEAGQEMLAALASEETASVEYWLYLEGCDEQCINEVQDRDLNLQFSFAGVKIEE